MHRAIFGLSLPARFGMDGATAIRIHAGTGGQGKPEKASAAPAASGKGLADGLH
jgi:hypothetical protein